MPEDWNHHQRVLVDASRAVLLPFFEKHAKDTILAIGYVFELWNSGPQFDLCAHVGSEHSDDQDERWNSGDYAYPAGLLGNPSELGGAWKQISQRLHEAAADQDGDGEIYRGLIDTSCHAMISLAQSGLFGDSTRLDFNVSEVGDPLDVVMARNQSIHEQIRTSPG